MPLVKVGYASAPHSALSQANIFSSHLVIAAQSTVAAPKCLQRARSASSSQVTTAELLDGTWDPPRYKAPKSTYENAQRVRFASQEVEEALAHPRNPLLSARHAGGSRPRNSVPETAGEQGRARGSSTSSRSSDLAPAGCGDSVLGTLVKGSSNLSHATTPSWRSRSFPWRAEVPGAKSGRHAEASDREPAAGERPRLPPLPMEARWAASQSHRSKAPPTELFCLERIDEAVHEANATLVESFLNVKRHPPSEVGGALYDAEPSCSEPASGW